MASPNFGKFKYCEAVGRSVLLRFWGRRPPPPSCGSLHTPVKVTPWSVKHFVTGPHSCIPQHQYMAGDGVTQPNNFHAKRCHHRTQRTGRRITQLAKQGEFLTALANELLPLGRVGESNVAMRDACCGLSEAPRLLRVLRDQKYVTANIRSRKIYCNRVTPKILTIYRRSAERFI